MCKGGFWGEPAPPSVPRTLINSKQFYSKWNFFPTQNPGQSPGQGCKRCLNPNGVYGCIDSTGVHCIPPQSPGLDTKQSDSKWNFFPTPSGQSPGLGCNKCLDPTGVYGCLDPTGVYCINMQQCNSCLDPTGVYGCLDPTGVYCVPKQSGNQQCKPCLDPTGVYGCLDPTGVYCKPLDPTGIYR